MKCKKCGHDLGTGADFCSCCGTAAPDEVQVLSLECKQCGGTMEFDEDQNLMKCPYCGHQSLMMEEDEHQERQQHRAVFLKQVLVPLFTTAAVFALIAAVFWYLRMPNADKINWDNLFLGDKIPHAANKRVEVVTNADDELFLHIYGMSQEEFYTYIRDCEEQYGFTIDTDKNEDSFWGYSEEGCQLDIFLYEEEMRLELYAPIDFRTYELPDYAVREGLPRPESDLGYYDLQYDDWFILQIGDTSYEEYLEYTKMCAQAGFRQQPSWIANEFYGENENGWVLEVCYEGNRTMSIDLTGPEE